MKLVEKIKAFDFDGMLENLVDMIRYLLKACSIFSKDPKIILAVKALDVYDQIKEKRIKELTKDDAIKLAELYEQYKPEKEYQVERDPIPEVKTGTIIDIPIAPAAPIETDFAFLKWNIEGDPNQLLRHATAWGDSFKPLQSLPVTCKIENFNQNGINVSGLQFFGEARNLISFAFSEDYYLIATEDQRGDYNSNIGKSYSRAAWILAVNVNDLGLVARSLLTKVK